MSIGQLQDVLDKARKLIGAGSSYQITDSMLIDYLNSFYLYDFPNENHFLSLYNMYTFNTVKGVDTYPFDFDHWYEIQEPCYVAKRATSLFQSPWSFYGLFFNWQQKESFATGDGTTGPYAGTTIGSPVLRSYYNNPIADSQTIPTGIFPSGYPPTFNEPNISRIQNILISAESSSTTMTVTDDGAGNLIGNASAGTIDYDTGAITGLTFTSAVPSGNSITIQYNQVTQAIPQAILFWQNNLVLRPVPDTAYTVEISAYRMPSQALMGSGDTVNMAGRPELIEWWETLSAGIAKKVFEDRGDDLGVQRMDKMLAERYSQNETRSYAQLGGQRSSTIYEPLFSGIERGGWFRNQ